jgi:hypothetical protein
MKKEKASVKKVVKKMVEPIMTAEKAKKMKAKKKAC